MSLRTRQTGRYLLPLAALLAAVAGLVAWLHFADPGAATSRQALAEQRTRTDPLSGLPDSLAVLPFRPGGKPGETNPQGFTFAHDLLRELARRPGLQVIAPTSSLYFRDSPDQRRRTAERLQAAWLVGGEWWRDGNALRLRLELYDARTGRLQDPWVVERPFDDPMATVRSVAVEIMQRLPVSGAAPGPEPARVGADAWRHYAEAVYHASAAGEPDLRRADEALQAALSLDPGFPEALLLRAELLLHPARPPGDRGERIEEARRVVAGVLAADPENGRALALTAWIRHDFDWDWRGALEAGAAAAQAMPGDAASLRLAGLAAFTMGEFGRAVDWLAQAAARDPLNLGGRVQLALAREHAREDEAALLGLRQVAVLNPGYPGVFAHRARLKLLEGKPEVALEESGREADPFWSAYANALAVSGLGREAEARQAVDQLATAYGSMAAFQVAELLALQGRSDEAFAWLDRAIGQRDGGLSALLGNRLLEPLQADPRWARLLGRLGLPLDSAGAAAENG